MTAPLPQLRKDPIVDRWVLIAPERAARPTELVQPGRLAHQATCPFCEGHEAETPPEVRAVRRPGSAPDGPGWRVRVIPNRFPAVKKASGTNSGAESVPDAFLMMAGYGIHEVVVECPQHEASLAALSIGQVRNVFAVYRDRLAALWTDPRLGYVQVFKNHGAAAGASAEHSHSQILAGTMVPPAVLAELDAAAAYHAEHGRCAFCDLVERELAAAARVVLESEYVVAIAAWAGRFPYETWLLPRRHESRYERLSDTELTDLAAAMRTVLQRLAAVAGDPAYNMVLRTAPAANSPHYHWRWEILPRTTGIAGYELATGCYLNPMPPEEAAARLRRKDN